jgi:hypothetical protein
MCISKFFNKFKQQYGGKLKSCQLKCQFIWRVRREHNRECHEAPAVQAAPTTRQDTNLKNKCRDSFPNQKIKNIIKETKV